MSLQSAKRQRQSCRNTALFAFIAQRSRGITYNFFDFLWIQGRLLDGCDDLLFQSLELLLGYPKKLLRSFDIRGISFTLGNLKRDRVMRFGHNIGATARARQLMDLLGG